MQWLWAKVDAVVEIDPLVAAADHWGNIGLLNAWQTRVSVALQKGNAALLLHTGRVRSAADFVGASGWEEDVEDLLRDAAAAAGVGGLEVQGDIVCTKAFIMMLSQDSSGLVQQGNCGRMGLY